VLGQPSLTGRKSGCPTVSLTENQACFSLEVVDLLELPFYLFFVQSSLFD